LGVVALGAVIAAWWSRHQPAAPAATEPVTASPTATLPAPAPTPVSRYEKLKGRWLRPDGGYILTIGSVAPDGTLDAAYLNPRPIHVAKAGASRDGEAVKVFIELRDQGYPGSTYSLTYDPKGDRLSGVYFQATIGQNFDVEFSRLPAAAGP
jgi:hypothetical protein